MGLQEIFIGVPQSKYAALAVVVAVLAVSVSILFGKDSMPISQKLGAILLLVLVSIPGVLYSLFQLTCLVTGAGVNNKRWWCSLYAWLISALLIVYSVLLITVAILSIFTGMNINKQTKEYSVENFASSMNAANSIAQTNDLIPPTAVNGTSMNGMYPPSPPVVSNAVNTGLSSNGIVTSSVANSTLVNNAIMPQNNISANVGTKRIGTTEQDRKNGPFVSAENPESYPFKSSPFGHGWEPMNGIDLPPGA
jgi:hypothetical protein